MESHEEIHDSPSEWAAKHIQQYVASDGREGHEWKPGVYTLLLTTRGRKTRQLRRTPLIYGKDGEDIIIVASRGGHPKHPAWYLNLVDNPEVKLQIGADKFSARAHTATPDEKARLWPLMASIWPGYNDYQAKTDREIPVVVLERSN